MSGFNVVGTACCSAGLESGEVRVGGSGEVLLDIGMSLFKLLELGGVFDFVKGLCGFYVDAGGGFHKLSGVSGIVAHVHVREEVAVVLLLLLLVLLLLFTVLVLLLLVVVVEHIWDTKRGL